MTLKGSVSVLATNAAPVFGLILTGFPPEGFLQSLRVTIAYTLLYSLCIWFFTKALKNITIPFFTSPLRHLPHAPNEWWFLAHGTVMFSRPPGARVAKWADQVPNDGWILYHDFFNYGTWLVLTKHEPLMEILSRSNDFVKTSITREFLAKFIGRGLIVSEGAEHKFQRRIVTPAFQGRYIKNLTPLFWSKSQEFVAAISRTLSKEGGNNADSGVFDVSTVISRVTLDIIGMACMNRNFDTLHRSDDELAGTYEMLLHPQTGATEVKYFGAWVNLPSWMLRLWSKDKRVNDAADRLRSICDELLAHHKEQAGSGSEVDILSTLIRAEALNDRQLIDQLLTFLAAGHETTSSSLIWTMYLLAANQQSQTRLREEVNKGLQHLAPSQAPDSDTLDSMPFLDGVCNESFRLFPPVPVTSRVSLRDTTVCGNPIPANTNIVICPWLFNRSPAFWGSDAREFNPDRWIDNASSGGKQSATQQKLLTFLHGPRSCIGQAFTRLELKCLLVTLIQNFRWKLVDESYVPFPVGVATIRPQEGLPLEFQRISS